MNNINITNKGACELKFPHCFLIYFTFVKCKITFFIKAFLISPILYKKNTLIDFGFFKVRLSICGFNFILHRLKRLHYFHSCLKFFAIYRNFSSVVLKMNNDQERSVSSAVYRNDTSTNAAFFQNFPDYREGYQCW